MSGCAQIPRGARPEEREARREGSGYIVAAPASVTPPAGTGTMLFLVTPRGGSGG